MNYLDDAYKAWMRMAPLRQARRRCKSFAYGRQWGDPASDADHGTEADEALAEGHRPLTNNMIRQLVKCVIGTFRQRTAGREASADFNQLGELDARMLEEFLISGCAIQRVAPQARPGGRGVWVDNVNPDCFFVNDFRDPRGCDIRLIGMLHSMTEAELALRFGAETAAMRTIRRMMMRTDSPGSGRFAPMSAMSMAGASGADDGRGDSPVSFFEAPAGMHRVIELWTLERVEALCCHDPLTAELFLVPVSEAGSIRVLNNRRVAADLEPLAFRPGHTMRWRCRWLTPAGDEIAVYYSPYRHCTHPFVVKFYPLIDGEVHSLVEDIIDQQRHINRLMTLIDHILSVSAKGALLFPTEAKPSDLSWREVAERWAKCGAVIPYDSRRCQSAPTQIVTAGENSTAFQLLDLNMRLFQQISGVSEALQGQMPSAATSAALYESQIQTSTNALRDLLDAFDSFRSLRELKRNQ